MNKKEILEYIKYNGRYTQDVKKRLKKLLKKYHPDNNKNDKNTILVLYQVKKELEDGTLKKMTYSDGESKLDQENPISDHYVFFIELLIKRLKNKRVRIDKKIEALYEKMNFHYEKMNHKQDELYYIETDLYEIEKEISELLRIDIVDIIIVIIILLVFSTILFSKLYFLVIIILFFIMIEIYYIYTRRKVYLDKQEKLKQVKRIKKNVNKEYEIIKDRVTLLEKDELALKQDKRRINDDISYYSNQLSNIRDKELSKHNKKVYTKK